MRVFNVHGANRNFVKYNGINRKEKKTKIPKYGDRERERERGALKRLLYV